MVYVVDVVRDASDKDDSEGWQERLSEAMSARGFSGGELARRTGFTAQYINNMKSGERGGRLPLDTARKLARALGVSVDWLARGEGPRERLSDVYPVVTPTSGVPAPASDRYPGRAEAIALLGSIAAPEVIAALRAVVPEGEADPGREWWLAYAKDLARDLKRIKDDPDLGGAAKKPPRSEFTLKKARRIT